LNYPADCSLSARTQNSGRVAGDVQGDAGVGLLERLLDRPGEVRPDAVWALLLDWLGQSTTAIVPDGLDVQG